MDGDGGQASPRPQYRMADSLPYPTHPAYIAQYYPAAHVNHVNHGHVHVVSSVPRQETTQRKRPKYTRSKTGCLTCRVKKIKCDETKPNCMRCTHGQRDCTWPEGVPARKKSAPRKEPGDRPSTAGSSGISEASTPPTREATPPRRGPLDLGLPPLVSRRPSDPYMQANTMLPDSEMIRRQMQRDRSMPVYPQHTPPTSHSMPMIPDMSQYPTSRYDHPYPNGVSAAVSSSRHNLSPTMSNMSPVNWSMGPIGIESYYHNTSDRTLVGHGHSGEHIRYQ
ncbi:hypothetical protein EYR40_006582 [Pleurotus pulmonarius]|nr:hypothetical protein EYR36_011203 [Pleurotus pulmonarius]KAF4598231.1 hypothetical protein EYR38_006627 [Pleurotus pulmonarius]KAF4599488.1 hypothetical protein EYR40_006582 [Pleurotus pulmonarius]